MSEINNTQHSSGKSTLEILKHTLQDKLSHVNMDKFQSNASFSKDLDIDSLDFVELISSLEDIFDIQFVDEEAESRIHTVADAVEYIDEKVAEKNKKS